MKLCFTDLAQDQFIKINFLFKLLKTTEGKAKFRFNEVLSYLRQ